MTKYVLLSEFYPPSHGGIQASLEPLVASLGDTCTVVAPNILAGERQVRRSLFSGGIRPRWWWLVAWLQEAQAEGMELAIFGHCSAAVIAAAIAGVPFVVLTHGNDILFEERRLTGPLVRWALRRAQWIGVNSSFVRDRVHRYGVPLVNILTTHPFVLAEHVRPTARQSLNPRQLITVARLVARKNVATVIHAVRELRQQYPDIHLDIVGDGPERQSLETLIIQHQVSNHITLHGAVDEETKWSLMSAAGLMVMVPTIERQGSDIEGFGLVFAEAGAQGLPVIGSATGGIRDAIHDGETGILLETVTPSNVANAIRTMIDNPTRALLYGEAGRLFVQREVTDTVRLGRVQRLLGNALQQPRVSVIIPAYQSASTIPATLASIAQQTYQPREIIIVDDGSTDNLEAAIAPWRDRLTYIRQENAGAPAARNAGFDRSTGDLVIFLDADITMADTMLERMVHALSTHPDVDYVYSDFKFGWKQFHLHEYSASKLRQMNYIHTSSLLRRSSFPRFDQSLKRFQDWDLWLTMAARGSRGQWIPATLFRVQPRTSGLGMSTWLPSFVYRLPFVGRGRGSAAVAAYRAAERIIRTKHRLA